MPGRHCCIDHICLRFPNANEMQLSFSDDFGLHKVASVTLDQQIPGKLVANYRAATRLRGETMPVGVSSRNRFSGRRLRAGAQSGIFSVCLNLAFRVHELGTYQVEAALHFPSMTLSTAPSSKCARPSR